MKAWGCFIGVNILIFVKNIPMRILFILLLASIQPLFGQKVSIDSKTELVSVDGQPAFYLMPTNKALGIADYTLTTLDKQDVAFFKRDAGEPTYNSMGTRIANIWFNVTFVKSGNTCVIDNFNAMSFQKSIAKDIASVALMKDGKLNEEAERVFILAHNGTFFNERNAEGTPMVNVNINTDGNKVSVDNEEQKPIQPVTPSVSVKGDKAYNHDELVATFKTEQKESNTIVTIYNQMDEKVAVATKNLSAPDEDWSVLLVADNKNANVRYNTEQPVEKLFEYLLKKGVIN